MNIRTAVPALLISSSLLAGCTPSHETAPVGEPTAVELGAQNYAEPLAPLNSQLFPPMEDGLVRMDTLATYSPGTNDIVPVPELPISYQNAMRTAIASPVFQYALSNGYINEVNFVTSDADNGIFDQSTGNIRFFVSQGENSARLYTHAGIFADVANHEAAHAIAEESWYSALVYGGEGIDSLSPALQPLIQDALSTCTAIRSDVVADFVTGHRRQLTEAFRQTAEAFIEYGHQIQHDDDPTNDRRPRMQRIAHTIFRTANTVEAGETYASGYTDSTTCDMSDVIEFPYIQAQRDGNSDQVGEYHFEGPTQLLNAINSQMHREFNERYVCLDDSAAIADRLDIDPDRPGGHPFDNLTEFFASQIASLVTNPNYVRDCIDALPPDEGEKLARLAAINVMIMDETDPELSEIISNLSVWHAETLDWLRLQYS